MKIVTCMKPVLDLDQVLPSDWMVQNNQTIDLFYANRVIKPYEKQVLKMLLGESGATPFVHGVKKARRIMAVNRDEEARIFQVSHQASGEDCALIMEARERNVESLV